MLILQIVVYSKYTKYIGHAEDCSMLSICLPMTHCKAIFICNIYMLKGSHNIIIKANHIDRMPSLVHYLWHIATCLRQ